MMGLKELFQSADWKAEKHVPVIGILDKPKKGEHFRINVSVGKEIAHPNKTEHHIKWIEVYFHPEGEKFPYQISRTEFSAHGASVTGPDTSTVYTHPEVTIRFKSDKPGIIYAWSYCNIHGLWENGEELKLI